MEISGKFWAISGLCLAAGIGSVALLIPNKSDVSKDKDEKITTEPDKKLKSKKQTKKIDPERDKKDRFLYQFSKKIFAFLKNRNAGGAENKDNVVQWLKDKFGSSLENTEDKFENFKTLCDKQKTKETKPLKDVEKEEFRLCVLEDSFPMTLENSKGNLHWWKDAEEYKDLGFEDWQKSGANIQLFEIGYKIQYNENFDSWFQNYVDKQITTSEEETDDSVKISDFFSSNTKEEWKTKKKRRNTLREIEKWLKKVDPILF